VLVLFSGASPAFFGGISWGVVQKGRGGPQRPVALNRQGGWGRTLVWRRTFRVRGDGRKNEGTCMSDRETTPKQLLHLVFGGELRDLDGVEFRDLGGLDIVGIYPNYAEALVAWRAAAQKSVDNAAMRYFIVHMHRLLEPENVTPEVGA
jgi:hypothetical protein